MKSDETFRVAEQKIEEARRSGAKKLDLSGRGLTELPEWLGQLTQLQSLNLSNNQLTALPEWLGRLTQLQSLDLSNNQLTALPESLGQLTQLQSLDLDCNKLTVAPEWLGHLTQLRDLRFFKNDVAVLPDSIRNLTKLSILVLIENHRLTIPPEITEKWSGGAQGILDYYFRTRTGARPLHEFKLILVGHGAVGKTALVNRLVRDSFTPTDMTRGIHIEPWQVQAGADTLAAHVWDFGGQDIMHGTHQFFLTRRSLYLLVLAARESRQNDDAEYWLKTINAFGGDSPVIVVLNKSDERPCDVNENALRKKYPAIRAFIKTDCLNARGMSELRAKISEVADQLEGVRDLFPEQWFKIKNRISGMRESYLTFEKFRKECAKLGEKEEDGQEKLAAVLHVLGIALNFRDDERLRETSVLNPLWVTGGIYSLLNDNEIAVRHGLLKLDDFARVLPEKEYPLDSHEFLRELMCKFELCFPIGEKRSGQYLIPELLGEQEPDEASPLDVNESLAFSYHYLRLLPHGLVPRLLVRLYPLIADELRWRTGFVLEWFDARALVKSDSDDRSVRIRVHGHKVRRRELLAIIRNEFDTLHRQFHGLLPVERIQLPEYPEVTVEYSHLEAAIRAGLMVMPVFTEGNMIQVSPQEILKCFEVPGEPRDAGDRGALEIEPTPPRHGVGKGGRQ